MTGKLSVGRRQGLLAGLGFTAAGMGVDAAHAGLDAGSELRALLEVVRPDLRDIRTTFVRSSEHERSRTTLKMSTQDEHSRWNAELAWRGSERGAHGAAEAEVGVAVPDAGAELSEK